jgi:hypothetical protein
MKTLMIVGAVAFALSTSAVADNTVGVDGVAAGVEGTGTTTYVPNWSDASVTNAYVAVGTGGSTSIQATDQCLAGDVFNVIGIGLPGPSVQFDMTDGTAEQCTCSPSSGFDASFSVSGNLAIVAMKYASGTDVFPADAALRIAPSSGSASVRQVRGFDSCGITAD